MHHGRLERTDPNHDVDYAPLLDVLRARADRHEAEARSPRTRELYAADQRDFAAWCRMMSLPPLPATAETVALYITHLAAQVRADGGARYKPTSISRKLAAIAAWHRDAGHDSPTATERVHRVMAGIRRAGDATVDMKWPLLTADVRHLIDSMHHNTWPAGVKAARDTAAILIGYASALRRSNVSALNVDQISVTEHGLRLQVAGSKTDQHGVGIPITVPFGKQPQTCPVCAWLRWSRVRDAHDVGLDPLALVVATPPVDQWTHFDHTAADDSAERQPGQPAFRTLTASGAIKPGRLSGDGLYRMLLRRLADAERGTDRYGFHSLRTGFVTQARRNGASHRAVRLQTQQTSDARIDLYDREFNPLAGGNAATMIGL